MRAATIRSPGSAHGLSRIDSNASLFVSFATSPGAVALDGEGRNSPYTKYLTQAIETPNLWLEDTFKRTLKGVYLETSGAQTPWISSTFFGDFVFRHGGRNLTRPHPKPERRRQTKPSPRSRRGPGAGAARCGKRRPPEQHTQCSPASIARRHQSQRQPLSRHDHAGRRGTASRSPGGSASRSSRRGQFAGRMLVVNWGESTRWSTHSARTASWTANGPTALLPRGFIPVAVAAQADVNLAEGSYDVEVQGFRWKHHSEHGRRSPRRAKVTN